MERVESRVLDAIDVDGMLEYLCELVSIPSFGGKETDAQRSVAAKLRSPGFQRQGPREIRPRLRS